MNRGVYRAERGRSRRSRRKFVVIGLALVVTLLAGCILYKLLAPTPVEKAVNQLQFDDSVTEAEKTVVRNAITDQSKTYNGSLSVSVGTSTSVDQSSTALEAYVPVTNKYASRQKITKADIDQVVIYVPSDIDDKIRAAIANALGVSTEKLIHLPFPLEKISDSAVALVPASQLSPAIKLLAIDKAYYLDNFTSGAVFRQAKFTGEDATSLNDIKLNNLPTKDLTFKVNMTGVTALTRLMQKKLNSVKDPKYFSEKIGSYLADADITHVSNEVSFKTGCTYSNTVFCSPPEMIETLKDSGVDLVELTGNHNNDSGNKYNTESINLYHSLNWTTFGGGLNSVEAAKFYVADKKQSKVAFLGYNYPDSPNGGAIAKTSTAGANSFDFDKIKADINSAKGQASFVIVDVQFWECYAYPPGYIEFPECDVPISGQEEVFRRIADLGADMVVGTQAHQPQTYENYKGKPIFYGLGNLYFEQTQWPGTERGIILSHYFVNGKLLQTKLSPTVYDTDLQTHLMSNEDAVELLDRLNDARTQAGL